MAILTRHPLQRSLVIGCGGQCHSNRILVQVRGCTGCRRKDGGDRNEVIEDLRAVYDQPKDDADDLTGQRCYPDEDSQHCWARLLVGAPTAELILTTNRNDRGLGCHCAYFARHAAKSRSKLVVLDRLSSEDHLLDDFNPGLRRRSTTLVTQGPWMPERRW